MGRLAAVVAMTLLGAAAPGASEAAETPPGGSSGNPMPATPPPGAEKPSSPAPMPTPPKPQPTGLEKQLGVGASGFFRPYLLLQAWIVAEHGAPRGCFTAGCVETTSTFRIRRAEVGAYGDVVPDRVSYRVTFDPARALEFRDAAVPVENAAPAEPGGATQVTVRQPAGNTALLQDAFFTLETGYADITLGQSKGPVSWEALNSAARLLFPERSIVARQLSDRRDLGLKVAKTFEHFSYIAGLFNGVGANALDLDNAKDAALRLEAYPVKGLVLAAVAYDSIGQRNEVGTRDRWELDFRFERGPGIFQSEFIRGRERVEAGVIDTFGWYAAGAWSFSDQVQVVARVGHYDPALGTDLPPAAGGAARDEVTQYDLGLNWYLLGHYAKVQLAYGRFGFDDLPAQDQLILAAQAAY